MESIRPVFFWGGAEVFQPLSFLGVHVHEYDLVSIPSLPKSSKYLLRRCLEPLKAFSGGVSGFKHLLIRYLED